MSAIGPKRTFDYVAIDVAIGGKADIGPNRMAQYAPFLPHVLFAKC